MRLGPKGCLIAVLPPQFLNPALGCWDNLVRKCGWVNESFPYAYGSRCDKKDFIFMKRERRVHLRQWLETYTC